MKNLRCIFGSLVLATVPVVVVAEDTEPGRRLLDDYLTDPGRMDQLRRNLAELRALPPERQLAVRQLDRQLSELDRPEQDRLRRVLERYREWLDRLPNAERQRVLTASTPQERLAVVREMRLRQWIESLPQKQRTEYEQADSETRKTLAAKWQTEQALRRAEWQAARQGWSDLAIWQLPRPFDTDAARRELQIYISDFLRPVLNANEEDRLRAAEREALQGNERALLRTIVELADRHPLSLPGPPNGPSRWDELPLEIRRHFNKEAGVLKPKMLREHVGHWPEFAIAVTNLAREKGIPLRQPLGPTRMSEMPLAVREFFVQKLRLRLSANDQARLAAAEGKWPDYPRVLLETARQHQLSVPGVGLPGPPEFWDEVRKGH